VSGLQGLVLPTEMAGLQGTVLLPDMSGLQGLVLPKEMASLQGTVLLLDVSDDLHQLLVLQDVYMF